MLIELQNLIPLSNSWGILISMSIFGTCTVSATSLFEETPSSSLHFSHFASEILLILRLTELFLFTAIIKSIFFFHK
jgi:hypothetical protein